MRNETTHPIDVTDIDSRMLLAGRRGALVLRLDERRDGVVQAHAPGTMLWVREPFARVGDTKDDMHSCPDLGRRTYHPGDVIVPDRYAWRDASTMTRAESRMTLVVEETRIVRLQDLTDDDCEVIGAYERSAVGDDAGGDTWTMGEKGWRWSTPTQAFQAWWTDRRKRERRSPDEPVAHTRFILSRLNIDDLIERMRRLGFDPLDRKIESGTKTIGNTAA